jgi:hypothetical protein
MTIRAALLAPCLATLALASLGLLTLAAPALAQDELPTAEPGPDTIEGPPAPPPPDKDDPEAPAADEGPGIFAGPYDRSPYARPVVSAVVFGTDGAAAIGASLGARAGIRYQNDRPGPDMLGDTYVQGSYIAGGVQGYDLRVGTMLGPFLKPLGIGTGPELATNTFRFGGADLGAATTLRWTLSPYLSTRYFSASAGVVPGWYVAGDRERWSSALHEYSIFAGAGVNLSKLRVSLTWSRLVMAGGTQEGWGVGFGF